MKTINENDNSMILYLSGAATPTSGLTWVGVKSYIENLPSPKSSFMPLAENRSVSDLEIAFLEIAEESQEWASQSLKAASEIWLRD